MGSAASLRSTGGARPICFGAFFGSTDHFDFLECSFSWRSLIFRVSCRWPKTNFVRTPKLLKDYNPPHHFQTLAHHTRAHTRDNTDPRRWPRMRRLRLAPREVGKTKARSPRPRWRRTRRPRRLEPTRRMSPLLLSRVRRTPSLPRLRRRRMTPSPPLCPCSAAALRRLVGSGGSGDSEPPSPPVRASGRRRPEVGLAGSEVGVVGSEDSPRLENPPRAVFLPSRRCSATRTSLFNCLENPGTRMITETRVATTTPP